MMITVLQHVPVLGTGSFRLTRIKERQNIKGHNIRFKYQLSNIRLMLEHTEQNSKCAIQGL